MRLQQIFGNALQVLRGALMTEAECRLTENAGGALRLATFPLTITRITVAELYTHYTCTYFYEAEIDFVVKYSAFSTFYLQKRNIHATCLQERLCMVSSCLTTFESMSFPAHRIYL